jgi:DNA invertase Pin-like site-specific DNA recombinase
MLHQQRFDTTTPAGKSMFQMMGVFAEFERAMIRERVNAGLERARAQGKISGEFEAFQARPWWRLGWWHRRIAAGTGVTCAF